VKLQATRKLQAELPTKRTVTVQCTTVFERPQLVNCCLGS